MVWISVDGLEGAGKTTLVSGLAQSLACARVLPEFSAGFSGKALAAAVKVTPHYISRSVVAQSLFFLGEFVEKIEESRPSIEDAHTLILSDRGLLSKIAYQAAVLRPTIGERTETLISACLDGLPIPDLTIWLSVEPQVAKGRVEGRGAPRNRFDVEFMRTAAGEFERAGHRHRAERLDATVMTASQVQALVYSRIVKEWPIFAQR